MSDLRVLGSLNIGEEQSAEGRYLSRPARFGSTNQFCSRGIFLTRTSVRRDTHEFTIFFERVTL